MGSPILTVMLAGAAGVLFLLIVIVAHLDQPCEILRLMALGVASFLVGRAYGRLRR